MVLVGLAMLLPALGDRSEQLLAPISGLADKVAKRLPSAGLWGHAAAGVVLALAWAPCVGPTLGAAFALAASGGSLGASMIVMTLFALGAATSLLVAGYGLGRLASSGRKLAGRTGQIGRSGLGLAFALVGAAILTGWDQKLEAGFIDSMPDWLVTFATRL
jgi:cytochrome c-type biogenesis protein